MFSILDKYLRFTYAQKNTVIFTKFLNMLSYGAVVCSSPLCWPATVHFCIFIAALLSLYAWQGDTQEFFFATRQVSTMIPGLLSFFYKTNHHYILYLSLSLTLPPSSTFPITSFFRSYSLLLFFQCSFDIPTYSSRWSLISAILTLFLLSFISIFPYCPFEKYPHTCFVFSLSYCFHAPFSTLGLLNSSSSNFSQIYKDAPYAFCILELWYCSLILLLILIFISSDFPFPL